MAKGVFLVGFVGNKGTFQHGLARILADKDLLFHLGYFGFCVLGLCVNELFYSLLVSGCKTIDILNCLHYKSMKKRQQMIELCAIVQLYVIQLINQFSHSYDHNISTIFIFVLTEYDTHSC